VDNITNIILKLQEHKSRFGKQAQNNTGAGLLHYHSAKQCVHAPSVQTVLKFEQCDASNMTLVWRL
jgi:hypothetical protein